VDTNERINYGDAYTRRRWRDAEETSEMLKNAQLNFSEAINPIVVQTMQLLVGDKSLQFRFVNSKTNPQQINYVVTYNKNTKKLRCPTTILQHMTLGIDTLSSSHIPNEYKFWDMPLFESNILTESAKKYYLYARVLKTGSAGTFILSENSIAMEGVAGYYHLLAGILNSEFEGERSFVRLYGFTEILPGQVFTDVISDTDRNLIIDLVAKKIIALAGAEIIGKITFSAGTSGYDNISDKPNLTDWKNAIITDAKAFDEAMRQVINQAMNQSISSAVSNMSLSDRDALAQKLGYANYNALATAATQGKTIINGGLIRTSLLDVEVIRTQILAATAIFTDYIQSLNLVTNKLTVTSGAKIGNFSIQDGWLICNATPASDVGYIDMRSNNTRIAFGKNLIPSTLPGVIGNGVTCTAIIDNSNMAGVGGDTYALWLKAAGNSSVRPVALYAEGGVEIRGGTSFVEECLFDSGISADILKHYRCFVYQPTVEQRVYLPSDSNIDSAFGYLKSGRAVVDSAFIRIHILATRWATSNVLILPSGASTPLIDRTGNAISNVDLNKGDCCTLTYFNRAWYLTSTNW
jgi:hypothetical protein